MQHTGLKRSKLTVRSPLCGIRTLCGFLVVSPTWNTKMDIQPGDDLEFVSIWLNELQYISTAFIHLFNSGWIPILLWFPHSSLIFFPDDSFELCWKRVEIKETKTEHLWMQLFFVFFFLDSKSPVNSSPISAMLICPPNSKFTKLEGNLPDFVSSNKVRPTCYLRPRPNLDPHWWTECSVPKLTKQMFFFSRQKLSSAANCQHNKDRELWNPLLSWASCFPLSWPASSAFVLFFFFATDVMFPTQLTSNRQFFEGSEMLLGFKHWIALYICNLGEGAYP